MSDGSDEQRGEPANEGLGADVQSEGDEGRHAEQASPPIADDATHEQTQAPAPPDDVGVPSDEELAREEEEQG